MAYKGKYKIKNTSKYIGDPTKVTYRSLWELATFKYVENNEQIKKWSSEVPIKYKNNLDNKIHTYYIDLYLEYTNGTIKLIEIKPEKQTIVPKVPKRKTQRYINECATYITNTSKWKAATQICKQNGYIFEIWTEHTLKSMGIKIVI